MRKIALACAVSMVAGILVACSEDETSTTPNGAADAGGDTGTGDDGSANNGTDAGSDSSPAIDAGDGEAGGGTCQPATDLAVAASGKANAVAKINNASGDFSGNSTDYAAVENTGTATTGGGFSNWTTNNGKFDATYRSVYVVLDTETPVTCMTYSTPTPVTLRYVEGWPASASWSCTGSVIVDEVSGKSVKYHFNGACAPLAIPSNSAVGSFTLDGHGTATTLP